MVDDYSQVFFFFNYHQLVSIDLVGKLGVGLAHVDDMAFVKVE